MRIFSGKHRNNKDIWKNMEISKNLTEISSLSDFLPKRIFFTTLIMPFINFVKFEEQKIKDENVF